jgi:hypothetical protein
MMTIKLQHTEVMDGSDDDTWGCPLSASVVFPCGLSISPENMLLVRVMTVNIETNRTAG